MFFADQVSQCAEEGAGLGWFECHCGCCEGFVGVEMCCFVQRDWRVEMLSFEEWRCCCLVEWRL
jgi:hypothetical protein